MTKPRVRQTQFLLFSIAVTILMIPVVVAAQDTTPPALASFSFAPTSINVGSAAQDVTVTIRVTDDLSGVYDGAVFFYSPSGQQWRAATFFESDRISGDDKDGTYQTTASFPQYSETGTWYVWNVELTDKAGNTKRDSQSDLIALGFPTYLQVSANRPPIATAGNNQQLECNGPSGTFVSLDGSGSSDPDGDALTYEWQD